MNRVLASFTRSEKSIIAFVMFIVCTGFGLKQWKDSRSIPLVFQAAPEETITDKSRLEKTLTPAGRINVNKADAQALETLPGVGPSLAAAIIQHRDQHGAFATMDDLDKVSGIGPALLSKMSPLVEFGNVQPAPNQTVSSGAGTAPMMFNTLQPVVPQAPAISSGGTAPFARPGGASRSGVVNINTASTEELDTLDGIGPALAQRIIIDRQVNGRFPDAHSLARVKGIGVKVLQNNRGRIRAD